MPLSGNGRSLAHGRVSPAIRTVAFVLALLAASPFTAPFSTLDLADLYSTDEQRPLAAAPQLKTAKDHSICHPGNMPEVRGSASEACRFGHSSMLAPAPPSRTHSILRL